MAYTPISQTKRTGGYVPIGTKPQGKKPSEVFQSAFPSQNRLMQLELDRPKPVRVPKQSITERNKELEKLTGQPTPFAATKTGIAVNTVLGLPKAALDVAREIPRGIAGTSAQLVAPLVGVKQEDISLQPKGAISALLGTKPIQPAKEGADLLKLVGVNEDNAKKYGPILYAGLTISDFISGPGKKKALIEAGKMASDLKSANTVLKNAGVTDDVIKSFKLDEKLVAAKTDEAVEQIFKDIPKEVVTQTTPLPKLPAKREVPVSPVRAVTTPAPSPNTIYHGTKAPISSFKEVDVLQYGKAEALYGKGLYVTDNPKVGEGYSVTKGLGGPGKVLSGTIKSDVKLLNLDEKLDDQISKIMEDVINYGNDGAQLRFTGKNGQQAMREFMQNLDGLPESEASEYVDSLQYALEEIGYDGFRHTGGQITGGVPSNVSILWDGGRRSAIDKIEDSLPASNPELPALPKLTPEMRMALETKRSDNATLEAVKERYAKAVSRTPDEDSKLAKSALTKTKDGIMELSSEILTPIASRLGRFSSNLKKGLREYESLALQTIKRDTDAVEPLLRKMKAMPKEDFVVLDLAMKNSDTEVIDALARRHGLTDDINEFRLVWDDLFGRAKEVGMDINYRANAFPRLLKNPEGFMNYLRGTDDWGTIDNLIRAETEKRGMRYADLTTSEKAEIVNNFVRGYGDKTVLSAPSPTKARTIEIVDENLAQFYEDTPTAIINYITRMNDDIEARRFFGKNLDNFDATTDAESNVGALILKGLASGDIKPNQVDEISQIIRSRFKRGKMNGGLQTYRNAELISTMGSITSAVTQLSDVVWTVFESGLYQTLRGAGKVATKGKGVVKRGELGIDNRIMYEFNETGFGKKMVDAVFKYTGMNKTIEFFQDTFLTAKLGKWQSLLKKDEAALRADLSEVLLPERVDYAVSALRRGEVNEDLKIALTGKVLDYQPLTKSEFPQKYLEMPNGRIFWMLKSFTLKQYDIFRTKAIDDIIEGARTGNAKLAARGTKNIVYLATLFMAANATADEIKDLILGRETPPSDRLVDNLWRLVGASKFDVYQAKEDGLGTALVKKILPPVSIADSVYKDTYNTVTDKEYERGPLKGEDYKLESTQRIPIVGKPYYWWFGRGEQKQEYKSGTSGDLPDLPPRPPAPPKPPTPPSPPKPPKP